MRSSLPTSTAIRFTWKDGGFVLAEYSIFEVTIHSSPSHISFYWLTCSPAKMNAQDKMHEVSRDSRLQSQPIAIRHKLL